MLKKNKRAHQNPHTVVLYLLTLLKEQHWAFPHTTKYVYTSLRIHAWISDCSLLYKQARESVF